MEIRHFPQTRDSEEENLPVRRPEPLSRRRLSLGGLLPCRLSQQKGITHNCVSLQPYHIVLFVRLRNIHMGLHSGVLFSVAASSCWVKQNTGCMLPDNNRRIMLAAHVGTFCLRVKYFLQDLLVIKTGLKVEWISDTSSTWPEMCLWILKTRNVRHLLLTCCSLVNFFHCGDFFFS